MTWERWVLALGITLFAAAQYGLVWYALGDLRRRPRVRGDKKMSWLLVILVLPLAGPLIYGMFGPIGFMPRPNRPPRQSLAVLNESDLRGPGGFSPN
ncbi:MAG: PLD nuclease N-terminal domain-containing protein [Thermomicrobiales bacterium]